MINSLNIGKYIYSTFNSNDTLKNIKVYPLVADNDAKYPFMVYKRNSIVGNGCKDGYYEDDVTIEIDIVTDKYSSGIDLANEVRCVLEKLEVSFNDMSINDTTLVLATEEYNSGAYVLKLLFHFKVNN